MYAVEAEYIDSVVKTFGPGMCINYILEWNLFEYDSNKDGSYRERSGKIWWNESKLDESSYHCRLRSKNLR